MNGKRRLGAYGAKRLVLYPWLEGLEKGAVRRWRVVCVERKLEVAVIDVGEPWLAACALGEIIGIGRPHAHRAELPSKLAWMRGVGASD